MSTNDALNHLGIVQLNIKTDGTGSLIMKLITIMGQCRFIKKSGWNEHQKYWYATEADVSAEVAPKMVEQKLLMIPNVSGHDVIKVTTRKGFEEILWTGSMAFTVVDGESGESLTFTMSGQGQDGGDKAAFKGQTGCQKYAILKLFQIETGLDPENDNGRDNPNEPGASQGSSNRSGQPNTGKEGQKSNSGQSGKAQSGSQPSGQGGNAGNAPKGNGSGHPDRVPGYGMAKELAGQIGWSLDVMMKAVNEMRTKRNLATVTKWNELDDAFKKIFYGKMLERKTPASQPGSGSPGATAGGGSAAHTNSAGSATTTGKNRTVPSAEDLTDVITLLNWDYGDALTFINQQRATKQMTKVTSWDNLDDGWKILMLDKLQKKLLGGE